LRKPSAAARGFPAAIGLLVQMAVKIKLKTNAIYIYIYNGFSWAPHATYHLTVVTDATPPPTPPS